MAAKEETVFSFQEIVAGRNLRFPNQGYEQVRRSH